jgi:predicted transcriptional regulator
MATERTHITLPARTLAQLDQAAEAERRSRSNMATIAIEEYLKQHASVTGASRLRDLERLANSNTGAPMSDPDVDPMPPSVGSEPSAGAPALGAPFGKVTSDDTVNAGRRQPISQAAHDANREHLARHARGGK